MHHLRLLSISLLLLTLVIATPANGGDPPKRLTLAQVVQVAEEFIVLNGYTDLPPTEDDKELSYESLEWESDVRKMLQLRRDTLERSAYGYIKRSRRGAGWTVVFRHKEPSGGTRLANGGKPIIRIQPDGTTGRAVTMDPFGRKKRMEHVDFRLKSCIRLKEQRRQVAADRGRVKRGARITSSRIKSAALYPVCAKKERFTGCGV
jgi:hypothetical protein